MLASIARSLLPLILIAPCLAHAADSSSASMSGTYQRRTADVQATVKVGPVNAGHAKVAIDLGTPGCAGQVDGDAVVQGKTVHLSVPSTMANDGMCKVDLVFNGRTLAISEDSCLEFHGASCDFSAASGLFHKR